MAGSALLAMAVASCGSVAYTVDEIDYESPQSPAAILIADPQVYSRASLINDRRQESEYLKSLLDQSRTILFTPQIVRDLKTVEALSFSLGLSFGKTVSGASTASNLSSEIEVAKLQSQLAVLQKQTEGIAAAPIPETVVPPLDLSKPDGLATPTTGTPAKTVLSPDVSALQAAIRAIQDQLKGVELAGGPAAPANTYSGLVDPKSDFADRQAYRRDLRAALSEAQLDDVHDAGGNALYRFQFQVTVLPPSGYTRRWGVAKLSIEAPQLSKLDITAAYYQWLAYISREIDDDPSGKRRNSRPNQLHNYDYDRYIVELGSHKYFNVIDLFKRVDATDYYCLEHGGASNTGLELVRNTATYGGQGRLYGYERLGTYAVPPKLIKLDSECRGYPADVRDFSVGSQFNRPLDAAKVKFVLSSIASSTPVNAPNSIGAFRSVTSDMPIIELDQVDYVPIVFCASIVDQAGFCKDLFPGPLQESNVSPVIGPPVPSLLNAAGGIPLSDQDASASRNYAVRSYSVLPMELAQRIGVTTESSQSLQTALSVGAQLSSASKAALDSGFLSKADARAQALSRQAMVVGFAGTESGNSYARGFGTGYFGWLFGPEFVIKDSKQLALQQAVRTYGVTSDVSVPGWWSYVGLDIESAWIANWQDAGLLRDSGELDKPPALVRKRVNLPISAATYESLTNFIASQQYGPQFSEVFLGYVTPNAIPACTSSVTIQIGGANIWRGEAVFLGGVRARNVSVLPSMKGIAAEFDMNAVYGQLVSSESLVQWVPLVVAAGQGVVAREYVYIIGKRLISNGAMVCQSPIMVPTDYETIAPTIVSFSPTEICSNAKQVPLVIYGIQVDQGTHVNSEFFEGEFAKYDSEFADTTRRLFNLTPKRGVKPTPGVQYLAIESDYYGTIGSVPLTIKACGK
jgi:hypothetical protein